MPDDSTNRCLYCGRHDGTLVAVDVPADSTQGPSRRTITVKAHADHAEPLKAYIRRSYAAEAWLIPVVFLLVIGCTIGITVAGQVSDQLAMAGVSLLFALMGCVFLAFPFATPETIALFGVRPAQRAIRLVAGLMLFGGLGGIAVNLL